MTVQAGSHLLKPFDRKRLRQAIERAARFVGEPEDLARRLRVLRP